MDALGHLERHSYVSERLNLVFTKTPLPKTSLLVIDPCAHTRFVLVHSQNSTIYGNECLELSKRASKVSSLLRF